MGNWRAFRFQLALHNHIFLNTYNRNNGVKRKQPTKLISEVPTEPIHAQKAAFWREKPLSDVLSQNWLVLGSINQIGAKAEELMRKEKAVTEAGFTTYPRVVLAMDFVEPFLKRSSVTEQMEDEKAKAAIEKTKFTKGEIKQVMDAIGMLGSGFPIVRSSAYGDAAGTGIYESGIVGKKSHEEGFERLLFNTIKLVLASHYTEGARIFREKLALPSGIAVMIEPAFIQSHAGLFTISVMPVRSATPLTSPSTKATVGKSRTPSSLRGGSPSCIWPLLRGSPRNRRKIPYRAFPWKSRRCHRPLSILLVRHGRFPWAWSLRRPAPLSGPPARLPREENGPRHRTQAHSEQKTTRSSCRDLKGIIPVITGTSQYLLPSVLQRW